MTQRSTVPSVQRMSFKITALNIFSSSLHKHAPSTDSSDFAVLLTSETRVCLPVVILNNVTDGPSYSFKFRVPFVVIRE